MRVAISQWPSVVISGHQRSSAVISGHQRSSVVISGHQRSSAVISGHLEGRRGEDQQRIESFTEGPPSGGAYEERGCEDADAQGAAGGHGGEEELAHGVDAEVDQE